MDDKDLARAIAAQKNREEELTRGFRAAQAPHNTSQVIKEVDPELARALRLSAEEAEVEALAKQVQQEEESRKAQGTKQLSGDTLSEEDFQKYLQSLSLGEAHPPTTTSQSYGKIINTEEPDSELEIALLLSQEQVQKKSTVQVNPDSLSDEDLEKFLQFLQPVEPQRTYRVNRPSSADRGEGQEGSTTVNNGDLLFSMEQNQPNLANVWQNRANVRGKNQEMNKIGQVPALRFEEELNQQKEKQKQKEIELEKKTEKEQKEQEKRRMKALEELEKTRKEYAEQPVNEKGSQ